MKICTVRGLTVAILTRSEYCPPHAHVNAKQWEARFQFSFWHNDVWLWDVIPARNGPNATTLEGVRQILRKPLNLRRAREVWWLVQKTICLDNQQWDVEMEIVVPPKAQRRNALDIASAYFDLQRYTTVLELAGRSNKLEIEL